MLITHNILEKVEVIEHINHDLHKVVTPVRVEVLEKMLFDSQYDVRETQILVNGFRNGFDLKYQGPKHRKDVSRNIPFTVGDQTEL